MFQIDTQIFDPSPLDQRIELNQPVLGPQNVVKQLLTLQRFNLKLRNEITSKVEKDNFIPKCIKMLEKYRLETYRWADQQNTAFKKENCISIQALAGVP